MDVVSIVFERNSVAPAIYLGMGKTICLRIWLVLPVRLQARSAVS